MCSNVRDQDRAYDVPLVSRENMVKVLVGRSYKFALITSCGFSVVACDRVNSINERVRARAFVTATNSQEISYT